MDYRRKGPSQIKRGAQKLSSRMGWKPPKQKAKGVKRAEAIARAAALATPAPGGIAAVDRGGDAKRGPPESQSGAPLARNGAPNPGSKALVDISAPARAKAIAREEAKAALKDLVAKCRAHTTTAVDVLVDVMQKSPHAPSRVAAAKALIEFGHGKAPESRRLDEQFTPEEMKQLAEAIVLRRAREGIIDGGKLGVPSDKPGG